MELQIRLAKSLSATPWSRSEGVLPNYALKRTCALLRSAFDPKRTSSVAKFGLGRRRSGSEDGKKSIWPRGSQHRFCHAYDSVRVGARNRNHRKFSGSGRCRDDVGVRGFLQRAELSVWQATNKPGNRVCRNKRRSKADQSWSQYVGGAAGYLQTSDI